MKKNKKYFRLLPHSNVTEILPNIYTVTGTMKLFGLFQYSRVMTILKDGDDLALINPVRVCVEALEDIEALGSVKHLFKIGQLHNVDIPFYMDKFSPKLWVNKNDPSVTDYSPDEFFDDYDKIPFADCRVKNISGSKVKEAFLVTPHDGGCLHSCDAFVNMGADPMHNWLTAKLSKFLPDPTYIGPNWVKMAKPPKASMMSVLNYEFNNFIPAHGRPILGEAKGKLQQYLENYYG